jgi:hypothetical protein
MAIGLKEKVTSHDLWLSDQEQGKYIGAHRGYINGRPGCPVATQNATLRGESTKNYTSCDIGAVEDRPVNNCNNISIENQKMATRV